MLGPVDWGEPDSLLGPAYFLAGGQLIALSHLPDW
jgi:hypothetical protein